MLVGNKSDLSETSRAVPTEEGGALAEQEGFLFVETSALDATNVDKAFETVFNTIYANVPKKKANEPQQQQPGSQPTAGERIQLRPPSVRSISREEQEKKQNGGGCC